MIVPQELREECTTKLAPIRVVFDNMVEKCKKIFNVSEYHTIDEMLKPLDADAHSAYIQKTS